MGDVSVQQAEQLGKLDEKSQKIMSALLDPRTTLPRELLDQRKAAAQMLNRMDFTFTSPVNRQTLDEASGPHENPFLSDIEIQSAAQRSEEERRLKLDVELSILETLRSPEMTGGLEEESEWHRSTYQAIFDAQDTIQSWSPFNSWLETGTGVYWISGKAGSGKSTLMRYIYDNQKTQQALSAWATSTTLVTAGVFFCNNGTKEERSQRGLLRALLFAVLSETRDLVPVVLPGLWAKRYSQALDPLTPHSSETSLSLSQLMQAFTGLIEQTKIPVKICLFIDGLDQYEGDFGEIVPIFEGVSRSPNMKLCLSSRPLAVLDESFSKFPALKLPDLTINVIKNYVKDELMTNKIYQQLSSEETEFASELEEEIVTSANGVFIWVRLVVESLLRSIRVGDSIHDLQKRLRILPNDLEKLYHHMLMNKIDLVDMDEASKMFEILRKTSGSQLSLFSFALTDSSYLEQAITAPIRPWDSQQRSSLCQKMEDLIKVRCAGLITVTGNVDMATSQSASIQNSDGKVQYLHLTAKDFLEKSEIAGLISSRVKNLGFDVNAALLQSLLLQLKTFSKPIPQSPKTKDGIYLNPKGVWDLAAEAMQYAAGAQLSTDSRMALIDQLGRTIRSFQKSQPAGYPEKWSKSFLAVAVQYNLWPYVETQLGAQALLKQGVTVRTLLAYTLGARGFHNYDPNHSKEMANILLKHATKSGTNSTIFKTSSIWQQALQTLEERYLEPDYFINQFEVVKLFLTYGADPQATCHLKDGRELAAETIIREGLAKYPHPATAQILGLLDDHEGLAKPKSMILRKFSSWSAGKSRLRSDSKTALI